MDTEFTGRDRTSTERTEDTGWHPSYRSVQPATLPIFVSLHGAYHAISQRVALGTRRHGLSPSEAVVLVAAERDPDNTISVLRRACGLRPSTASALLGRLEQRELLVRYRHPRLDPRLVLVRLTPGGRSAAAVARHVLDEVDEELAVFVPDDQLAGAQAMLEASFALPRPGFEGDY